MILAFLLVVHLHKSEMLFFFILFFCHFTDQQQQQQKRSAKQLCGEKLFMSGVCQKKKNHSKQFKQWQGSLEKHNVASS